MSPWLVLKRTLARFRHDRTTTVAGGVTFFSLVAIFPALAAAVSLYGLFSDPDALTRQIDALRELLPSGATELLREQMRHVIAESRRALGTTFLITLGASLWSARTGMKALLDALDLIYDTRENRGIIRRQLLALVFTVAAICIVLLSIAVLIGLPIFFASVGLAEEMQWVLKLARWPLLLIVIMLALALIYRFGPNREKVKWRWISWGSVSAAALWLAASILFSWYAANFGTFNQTYGTLGAVIVFMMWLWISATAVLAGAQLNAELERQDPALPLPPPEGSPDRPTFDE
ncbi:MAG: YihY/virulence factor BrkB family protein [Xanthobacteraceae bacterium]